MKLPETKQDKIKLLIVVIMASVLVLLGVVKGILDPLRKSKRDKLARLEQCESELASAQRVIKFLSRDQKRNVEALKQIKEVSDQHLLHPVLGNYLLSATDIVETHAGSHGLKCDDIREIGITELPRTRTGKSTKKKGAKANSAGTVSIRCYTVRVTLLAGYSQLVELLNDFEKSNPYLCVVEVQITGSAGNNPERHSVSFQLQWPIWNDPDVPGSVEQQLKEEGEESDEQTS